MLSRNMDLVVDHGHYEKLTTTERNIVISAAGAGKTSLLAAYSAGSPLDVMCRISSSAATTTLSTWQTADFSKFLYARFSKLENSVHILRSVVSWQKHRIDYDALHAAYTLGAITEEEFLKDAEQFVREQVSLPSNVICQNIAEINEALDGNMSVDEYADFLNVDVDDVLAAVPHLPIESQSEDDAAYTRISL